MISISNEKLRPFVSVKLNKPQLLVSSDLRQDIVKVPNYTPCTTLGQYQTRSLINYSRLLAVAQEA